MKHIKLFESWETGENDPVQTSGTPGMPDPHQSKTGDMRGEYGQYRKNENSDSDIDNITDIFYKAKRELNILNNKLGNLSLEFGVKNLKFDDIASEINQLNDNFDNILSKYEEFTKSYK